MSVAALLDMAGIAFGMAFASLLIATASGDRREFAWGLFITEAAIVIVALAAVGLFR